MEAYSSLLSYPIGSLGYLLLAIATLSLWIKRKVWIWLPLVASSYALAIWSGIADVKTLIPIGMLLLCHGLLSQEIGNFWRLFAGMIAAVISFALLTHFVKGFHNIVLINHWQPSADGIVTKLYLNYDKPFIGFFVAAIYLPLITKSKEVAKMLAYALPWGVMTIVIILGLGIYLHIIEFDPKLPLITFLWLLIQLFFVVIPEELFFRGFLVREIALDLRNSLAGILAILVVALLQTLAHIMYIPNLSYLVAVFITCVLYGGIYLITGAIESAILVHLMVNATHFFFFTYPILQLATTT